MQFTNGTRQSIQRLFDIRGTFNPIAAREKLQLLELLAGTNVRTGTALKRFHHALCFVSAFPDTLAHYRLARAQLDTVEQRVSKLSAPERLLLWDTGIAGTPVHYRFSFEVASWMADRAPGVVALDWDDIDDTSRLDELLERVVLPCEADFFNGGDVGSREWIELAAGNSAGNDFDWLLAQMREPRFAAIWSQLYNAADLSLTWKLGGSVLSKSRNMLPVRAIGTRERGMRKRTSAVKREIMRPVASLSLLSPQAGSRLIDVAMASLAVRHRETYHFNHANPGEVYLADVGEGVSIAVFGLYPKYRYPLECTMGFLILANGMPIGYGGSSIVFSQVNTGINIFDEFRGGEAYFLWIQVMRVYHHLAGCTRFIADSYQIGNDNDEALHSGAFWFYYRLGYRPILSAIRKLAQRELDRIRRNAAYRSNLATLRRLSSCDMHLTLPGALASELFDERQLEMSSLLATRELAAAGGLSRRESVDRIALSLARDLNLRNLSRWSPAQREAFRQLAPIVLATKPASWPNEAKRSMRRLLATKGGPREADFARLLSRHGQFLAALSANCRAAENQL